jgi:hypothetical protein
MMSNFNSELPIFFSPTRDLTCKKIFQAFQTTKCGRRNATDVDVANSDSNIGQLRE